jgi:putative ABC transport system permease protein
LFRKEQVDRELDEELRAYQEMAAEEKMRQGMSRSDALRAVRLEKGSLEASKEVVRSAGWESVLETCWQDLRHGARVLGRNPGFTAVAVLTLALGIGADTAIFSLVNGILLQPLPFAQPEQLVAITDWYPQGTLVAMRANLHSMEVAGYSEGQELNLTGLGEPVRLYGTAVSGNLFPLLGVRPELGRTFFADEDHLGKDRVVILSHELWVQKFAGDANVIGRWVTLEGQARQIVGVMPAGFQLSSPMHPTPMRRSASVQFWIPLHLDPRALGVYWGSGFMPVIGRLHSGVRLEQARSELRAYIPQLRGMFPWKMPDALWASSTVIPLQDGLVAGVSMKLLLLFGATAFVLVIACVNVANLLLARSATRQKEMAMRAALGAGRWRICQQLLTESLILAIGGGMFGLVLAVCGLRWLKTILPADTPQLATVAMNWQVMAFTAGIAVLTGLFYGTFPAFHASRIDLNELVKTGWHSSTVMTHRVRSGLAIAEVALGIVLVIAAGLLVRSLWLLSQVNPGFRSDFVLTARITPNQAFCADFTRCQSFYDTLLDRTRALPGVQNVAVVNVLPLGGRINAFAGDLEDHPRDPKDPAPVISETIITPDYLRLMGIPLLRGRGFTADDMRPDAPPVALVTVSTARKFWPDQNAIGKHLKRVWTSQWTTTIVGVTADVNEYSLASPLPSFADGAAYVPYGNGADAGVPRPADMTLVVRVTNNLSSLAEEIRKVVSSLNGDVPVSEVRTLGAVVSESVEAPRSTMWLFSAFALLALILGAVGIYGVFSYYVTERTHEIGVRVALGAKSNDILLLVVRKGVELTLIGIGIGVLCAIGLTRVLSSLLYGVSPTDPLTFAAVSVVLTGVALLASYIPARRATKVDPMVALRYE